MVRPQNRFSQDLFRRFPVIELLADRSDSLLEQIGEDHYQLYYPVVKDKLAAPVTKLEFNRENLEGAIALERTLIGDKSRDDDPRMPDRIAERVVSLLPQFAHEELVEEVVDDEEFLDWIESPDTNIGAMWFAERLQRWLDEKDAAKLGRLLKALSRRAQIRRGPKRRSANQEAMDRALELWPKVEKAARSFARDWRGEGNHEYRTAAREELIELFLGGKSREIKDDCLKRICDRKLGLTMRTAVEEARRATGGAVGAGFRSGASAQWCCVCCAGRISSRCRGHGGSRRRGPRTGVTSCWPRARRG